jgi:hypothetical protein
MGLVRRGNTLCYYWSTRWFGEVRTTRYGIPGVPGFALEIAEDVRRLRRKVTRWKAKRLAKTERKKRALAEADQAIAAWCRDVEARVAAVLEPLGYDRRHRHGWRKRRMATLATTPTSKPPAHTAAMLARHHAATALSASARARFGRSTLARCFAFQRLTCRRSRRTSSAISRAKPGTPGMP